MSLSFGLFKNLFDKAADGVATKEKENNSFTGDIKFNLGEFDVGNNTHFDIFDGTFDWIRIKVEDNQMDLGSKVGGDFTAVVIHGLLDLSDASVSGLPGASGILYWSCSGYNFTSRNPKDDDITISNGIFKANVGGIFLLANVTLPHEAIITAVIVHGSTSARTWTLYRQLIDGVTNSSMATANLDSEDTSITNATVDNENYKYYLQIPSMGSGEAVHGARIKYTLQN